MRRAWIVSAILLAGCASAPPDDARGGSQSALGGERAPALVYFHGMSRLGFPTAAVRAHAGDADVMTPSLGDAQLLGPISSDVLAFLKDRQEAVVSGYSLGRVPVLRLLQDETEGITRVVLVDPTYDNGPDAATGAGGEIVKTWLTARDERTFLFVYGDVTKQVGGERSYLDALDAEPRAVLCYVPGDHARFRAADMAKVLEASDCADLKARLAVR